MILGGLKVEKDQKHVTLVDFQCNLHREFTLKINQNHRKWKVFQLPPPVSPSSDGIFRPNKFLACVVMSQKAQK